MKVGEIIQHIREEKGLNQKELAQKVGLSHSVMNRIELGTRPVRDEELKKIAEVLGTTTDYLLGASDIRNPYINIDKFISKNKKNTEEDLKAAFPHLYESLNKQNAKYYIKEFEEKYPDAHDVEEAMKIILDQPGLMLKGELLSDESKIILANAIQMGLRTAEELEKKKSKKGDGND